MKRKALPFLPGWLFSVLRWPGAETTEWFCLRSAMWWVIQLAPSLHLFAVSPSFAGLARYGAEGRWQMILGTLLIAQVAAVCVGNVWMRVGALVGFGTVWAFIAGLFWASSPHCGLLARNTGVGVYASLAVDCMMVAIHLVRLWYVDFLGRQERAELAKSHALRASAAQSHGAQSKGLEKKAGSVRQEQE